MPNDSQINPDRVEYDSDDEFRRDAIAFKLRNANDDAYDSSDQDSESEELQIKHQLLQHLDGQTKEDRMVLKDDKQQPVDGEVDVKMEKEKETKVEDTKAVQEESTTKDFEFIKPEIPTRSRSRSHEYLQTDDFDEIPGATQTRNFAIFSSGEEAADEDSEEITEEAVKDPIKDSTKDPTDSTSEKPTIDKSEAENPADEEPTASPPKRRRMFTDDTARAESPPKAVHTSLHHSLLGQSLTKNGQESVDQERVAQIIYEATKGSAFFIEEQRKDERLTKKIENILALKTQLDKTGYKRETRMADEKLKQLEATRDLSQIIVQVDCDAFYASVEELDNPELKEIPFAVGQGGFGVLTTANYKARKFGVRSGMAEHVAKKLCPQLTVIPPDYRKYLRKSREIRAVLSAYDDQLEASSIDECYLNITDYCEATGRDPETVVDEMRRLVAEKTLVTVSAGISPNDLLSKIASNRNKPNGQFRILPTREAVMDFMSDLPCRKVPGIGKSWERQLSSIGILKVRDIYPLRGLLLPLFKPAMSTFLLQIYLGLGRTHVQPSPDYERKGVGTERTFAAISGHAALVAKIHEMAHHLAHDVAAAGAVGRKLTLRLKFTTFQAFTRQRQLPRPIHSAEDIIHFALPLLATYESQFGTDISVRCLGLQLTDLAPAHPSLKPTHFADLGHLPAEFVKRGKSMEMGRVPSLPESEYADLPPMQVSPRKPKVVKQEEVKEEWVCPICGKGVEADDRVFNEHVDGCLNKEAIKEVVRNLDGPVLEPPAPQEERQEVIPVKKVVPEMIPVPVETGGRPPPPKMLMLDRESVVREGSKSPRGKRKREPVEQVGRVRTRGIESFFKK